MGGCVLALVDVLSFIATFSDEGVDDEGGFGQSEGVDIVELAQL